MPCFPVTIQWVGVDFRYPMLDYQGVDFKSQYDLEMEYGIRSKETGHPNLDFIPKDLLVDGSDVTEIVVKYYNNKKTRNQIIEEKIIEAKRTGKKVLISKIVALEEDTPLRNDGEGDVVDCCIYAYPDGTTKMEYYHNY